MERFLRDNEFLATIFDRRSTFLERMDFVHICVILKEILMRIMTDSFYEQLNNAIDLITNDFFYNRLPYYKLNFNF